MRFLDILVYVLVLAIVIWTLIANGRPDADTPQPLPDHDIQDGPTLPDPSIFDEHVLVRVDQPQDGIGTAFSIDRKGHWLTARHVVEGCKRVSLLVAPGQYVPVRDIAKAPGSDLALLSTGRSPSAVSLDLTSELRVGEFGFHVGYPRGRPGEAATQLLSRSQLITRGVRRGREPVLAWAEIGRTRGLRGSLGGLSGGPVFDADGQVRGVVLAESPRRGRIYSAAPRAIRDFLETVDVTPGAGDGAAFSSTNYGGRADDARNALKVVKVACRVAP